MKNKASIFEAVHYTVYWTLEDHERLNVAQYKEARYAASKQFERVKPNDVLWIVHVHAKHLYLLGRIKVAAVVDDTALAQELAKPSKEWTDAEWYAIPDSRDVEPLRTIDITPYVGQLGYVDLPQGLRTNPIDAQQFRSVRQLTDAAAEVLNELWYSQSVDVDLSRESIEQIEDDRAYSEGKVIVRTLQERQRSRALVIDAKQRGKKRDDLLSCEACGFSFVATYGVDYIEAHHSQQVASFTGERQSTVDDLHLLCANCHRMVHTQTPPLSIEQLQDILTKQRKLPPTRNEA
jgi:predicted HNH restriction endonuclease